MTFLQKHGEVAGHVALDMALIAILPWVLDTFWVNMAGKYLAFAFVAIGIVLSWGYCGILSLGQGIFFAVGGYAMAMFLKLEASAPELPDFMVWSSVEQLPAWWEPFKSFWFSTGIFDHIVAAGTALAAIRLPPICMKRRRVTLLIVSPHVG
jgi:urea transport system permease protein